MTYLFDVAMYAPGHMRALRADFRAFAYYSNSSRKPSTYIYHSLTRAASPPAKPRTVFGSQGRTCLAIPGSASTAGRISRVGR